MGFIFRPKSDGALPLSRAKVETNGPEQNHNQGLRRRLSSLNLNNIHPAAAEWALRRSKSVSSFGDYAGNSVRKWWEWGCGWILSRKPAFAVDLEMNEEETAALGTHNKGSWRHILFKLSSQLSRKLLGADDLVLPQTFRPHPANSFR